jgi:type I restriction enzyme, R subunit
MLQVREEYAFTNGQIIIRGKMTYRGKRKRADFVLYYKPNIPVALIEAKDNNHGVGDGMQQGLGYAATLNIPFVLSSNGDGFVFHDRTGRSVPSETSLGLDAFPSPPICGRVIARGRALMPRLNRSCFRTISTTAVGGARVITR